MVLLTLTAQTANDNDDNDESNHSKTFNNISRKNFFEFVLDICIVWRKGQQTKFAPVCWWFKDLKNCLDDDFIWITMEKEIDAIISVTIDKSNLRNDEA
jgi:hypothetical protein